jgi:hypothetical protein
LHRSNKDLAEKPDGRKLGAENGRQKNKRQKNQMAEK